MGERLSLDEWRLYGGVGYELKPGNRSSEDPPWSLLFVLEGGLRLISVTAPGVPGGPSQLRGMAMVSAAVGGAYRLIGPLYVSAEVGASLTPVADRYRIEPVGEVTGASQVDIRGNVGLSARIEL